MDMHVPNKGSSIIVHMTYLSHEESLREQHDLTDLLQVWYDHHHWSEESLHTLRELCTTSIAWVHCDEDANAIIHCDLHSFKLERGNKMEYMYMYILLCLE